MPSLSSSSRGAGVVEAAAVVVFGTFCGCRCVRCSCDLAVVETLLASPASTRTILFFLFLQEGLAEDDKEEDARFFVGFVIVVVAVVCFVLSGSVVE